MAGRTPVEITSRSLGAHVATLPYGPTPCSSFAANLSALASAHALASPTAIFTPCATSPAICLAEAAAVDSVLCPPSCDDVEGLQIVSLKAMYSHLSMTHCDVLRGLRYFVSRTLIAILSLARL
jgi:hypothetical protein